MTCGYTLVHVALKADDSCILGILDRPNANISVVFVVSVWITGMLEWAENMCYASTDFKFIFISI